MTKREAAIVSAYTGYLIGDFSDFSAYAEEVMGRPIFTHEFPSIADELKEKSKKDFMSIKIEEGTPEWLYHTSFERCSWVDFDAVEKALGFRLFGYQKSYILRQGFRQMGRTTAEILRMLFNKEQYDNPINFSGPARNRQKAIFRQQFRDIWEKLHDAGIEMRPVFWSKEDKKKYEKEHYDPYKYARTWLDEYDKGYEQGRKDAIDNLWSDMQGRTERIKQSNPPEFLTKCMNIRVPDCNDCGYLNYTERQQQAYGANSYMKDHRCNCYERPVYHRASFQNYDSYIYPCEECKEDNFVNYFDCESSKCNNKGEQNDN